MWSVGCWVGLWPLLLPWGEGDIPSLSPISHVLVPNHSNPIRDRPHWWGIYPGLGLGYNIFPSLSDRGPSRFSKLLSRVQRGPRGLEHFLCMLDNVFDITQHVLNIR